MSFTAKVKRAARARLRKLAETHWRRLPPADLPTPDTVVRRCDPAGPHSLSEPDMPRRLARQGRATGPLLDFVRWADVERADRLRWRPDGERTFCNIYAHDYCHAAGVYLPRTWWLRDAIEQLRAGRDVPPIWGETVYEMDANGLHDWLLRWGHMFGWQRASGPDALQGAANRGAVAVISSAHADRREAGHIAVVLPERDGLRALRRDGQVILPLQSEAGGSPLAHGVGKSQWWTQPEFRAFAFFRNTRRSRWRSPGPDRPE